MYSVVFLMILFLVPLGSCNTVIVILACDRTSHLRQTIRSLRAATPDFLSSLPVFVSIDDNPKAKRYAKILSTSVLFHKPNIRLVIFLRRVNRALEFEGGITDVWLQPAPQDSLPSRARIARHYALVLERVFLNDSNTHAILLEDDLRFSPDFLTYLTSALQHLQSAEQDQIVCASGWNDNGFGSASASEATLTSFFPGLGWGLHRSLWEALHQKWPAYGTDIVGIGWDYWLRLYFDHHGWTCITPLLSRVRHAGAYGANVNSAQATNLYAETRVASVAIGEVQWEEVLRRINVQSQVETTQARLNNGRVVYSIQEAVSERHNKPVLPYGNEEYSSVAHELRLWPTPRGHFRHTLLVKIDNDTDVLLYDKRRASRYFAIPTSHSVQLHDVTLLQGRLNETCDQTCQREQKECSPEALEVANDCATMLEAFSDCKGCSHETGKDLPAMVDPDSPLETAGWCLVTESGMGDGGKLMCSGRFRWTRRLCGCLSNVDSKDEL